MKLLFAGLVVILTAKVIITVAPLAFVLLVTYLLIGGKS
jgi:hypothetical protein